MKIIYIILALAIAITATLYFAKFAKQQQISGMNQEFYDHTLILRKAAHQYHQDKRTKPITEYFPKDIQFKKSTFNEDQRLVGYYTVQQSPAPDVIGIVIDQNAPYIYLYRSFYQHNQVTSIIKLNPETDDIEKQLTPIDIAELDIFRVMKKIGK